MLGILHLSHDVERSGRLSLGIRNAGIFLLFNIGVARLLLVLLLVFVLALLILPLVDHLKNSILVGISELPVDLPGFFGVGHDDLVQDEFSDNVLVDGVLLKLKVVVLDRLSLDDLVIVVRIVKLFQEWVLQHLLRADPLRRVVSKQLADQVDGAGRSVWDELTQGLPLDAWLLLDHELQEVLVPDLLLDHWVRKPQHLDEALEVLIGGVGSDEYPLVEELSEDASHGPHVDGRIVVGLKIQVQFRSSVVPGSHILGQVVVFVDVSNLDVRLAEVTDFNVPVFVDKNIKWLHVSVDDAL